LSLRVLVNDNFDQESLIGINHENEEEDEDLEDILDPDPTASVS
jgi:hypothetical protein